MRKKFFAVYALVGALVASPVFTSCIDGEESESVTAVRTQKAEAMRIANQIAAANAELQIQRDKLALEKDIANYEALMANYEAQLLQYQWQIKQNQKNLDEFGVVALSTLTNNYTAALQNIASSEFNIVKYNLQIAQLQEDYLSSVDYVASETARLEAEIAAKEAEIEEVKKLQADGLDKSSMDEKIEELRLAHEKAKKDLKELENKYGSNAANTVTAKAMADLTNTYYELDAEGYPVLKEAEVTKQKAILAQAIETAEKNLADAIAKIGNDTDKKDTEYSYIDINQTTGVETVYEALTLYAELAKEKAETLGAPKSGETAATGAYIILEALEADVKAAKDALAANTDETLTAGLETAVATAEAKLLAYKTDKTKTTDYDGDSTPDGGFAWAEAKVAAKEQAILTAKDGLVALENSVATAKDKSEKFEANIAAFAGEDFEAYKEAMAALKAANAAEIAAGAEHTALSTLYSSFNDGVFEEWEWNASTSTHEPIRITTEQKIKNLEGEIKTIKETIAELEAVVEYYYNGYVDVDSEEMLAVVIAHIEELIAIEEVKLATYKKQAEEAKAALDAYLAE